MLLFILTLAFIAITVSLAWYVIAHDRGEREPVRALWIAVGFGFVGVCVASLIESFVLSAHDLSVGRPLLPLLLTCLTIGLIEEVCKFIPLSLFIYRKHYFNEHSDGIIYFTLAGLGFGLPENILYTLQFGSAAGIGRLLLTPFFHATTTGMVGYFLAKSKVEGTSRKVVWFALGAAILLHALYDFGLASGSGYLSFLSVIITFSLSIGLFVFYRRATSLDQAQGLSAVGINMFCRNCGTPNPDGLLYCTQCGEYA